MANEGRGFSGKGGTAKVSANQDDVTVLPGAATTVVCEVTKWTLDPSVAVSKYNSNKTGGHKKAVGGVRDTKGTIEIKLHGSDGQQLKPGDRVGVELHVNDSGNDYFQIEEAIISGAPINCDIDNGEVVGETYPFEASDLSGFGLLSAYGDNTSGGA